MTAALRSPHTVQLYDFGVNDSGSFYYVMEFLNGLDLHQIGTRFGPQPAERVIMLLRQACRSLAEAHERGLVHRDIKPANVRDTVGNGIRLRQDPRFRCRQGAVRTRPRCSNPAVGRARLPFMLPEIVLGEKRIDGRADCIRSPAPPTGRSPPRQQATTPAQMLLQHVQARPVPLSERSELVIPRQLEAILMMCLEKDPARHCVGSRTRCAAGTCAVRSPWTNERAQHWGSPRPGRRRDMKPS